MNKKPLLRAVKPEAVVTLDGVRYDVGGLVGQPDLAFLRPDWLDALQNDAAAFQVAGFALGRTPGGPLEQVRHADRHTWPPPGIALTLRFRPPAARCPASPLRGLELYDGIPLLAKWLTVRNNGSKVVRLNAFTSEVLGMVEANRRSARAEAGNFRQYGC